VMQTICTEVAEFEEVLAIAVANEGVYCSVGVHPNDSAKQDLVEAEWLIEKTAHPKVIGIGETGLDYHYETSPRELQTASFLAHIKAAQATNLPIIIHTRDADADTATLLKQETSKAKFKGVLHCFTSSKELADIAVELGFYISLSGIITFKNSAPLREAIRDVPLDRLLVETDAPFLAPIPFRSKRNEPAHVVYTNRMLAEIKGISEEKMAELTTENFFRLFDKAKET